MKYFAFAVLGLIVFEAVGQTQLPASQYRYTSYTTRDGKSHNSTLAVIQDKNGFIWMATHNGLDRFDGYNFVNYQNDPTDSTSLPYNRITEFCIDKEDNFWIGTSGMGLIRYLPEINGFKNYRFESSKKFNKSENDVTAILDLENGNLLIGTRGGQVNLFDTKTHQFTDVPTYVDGQPTTKQYTVVRQLLKSAANEIWVGTSVGILKYDIGENKLYNYYKQAGDLDNHNLDGNRLASDGIGNIWSVTPDGIIWRFDPKEYQNVKGEMAFRKSPFSVSGRAYSIFLNSKNELMVGSQYGLCFFDLDTKKATISKNISGDEKSLSTNRVESIYEDSNGIIWLGSDNEGVNLMDLHQKPFSVYKHNPYDQKSLMDNFVRGLAEDEKGDIWLASNSGISQFSKDKQEFENHSFMDFEGFEPKVNAISVGRYPYVWVGTSKGLIQYNTKTRAYKWYQHQTSALSNNEIFSLALDQNKNTLWIGTWGGGFNELNLDEKTFRHVNIDTTDFLYNAILAIEQDKEGNLWMGTFKHGVVKYSPGTKVLEYYNSTLNLANELGDEVVISMYIDETGAVLAGTASSGVAYYDKKTNAFKAVKTDIPTSHLEIKGLSTDENLNIWASTSKGITKFDFSPSRKTNGGLSGESRVFLLHFNEVDGLQSEIFYKSSFLKDREGLLYFGGTKGFNVFDPNEITVNPATSKVVIASVKIHNKEVMPGREFGERIILSQPIYQTDKIVLSNSENNLSMEFSAMNFVAPEKIRYKYILEGLDKDWVQVDHNGRKVSYSNLAPNTYTFKIASTNVDGYWDENITELTIKVLPAWWKTLWFRATMIALMLIFILAAIKTREVKLRKSKQILEEKVKHRTLEVVAQAKEIQAQNEELQAMNEGMSAQAEFMSLQNNELTQTHTQLIKTQDELKAINSSLDEKVKDRTAHLEKVINELDMFVYSASHDLGAPLKSLLGLVHLTAMEIKDPHITKNLAHMESSILKLENVIAALKQYSRNSSLKISLESIDLHQLVNDTLEELKYVNNIAKIKVSNEVPERTIVQTDGQRIRSIMQNIIDNAIKYSDLKKEASYVNVSFSRLENSWCLIVEDNGIGIGDANIKNVFNMFYRATTESSGSGLGLFIVKESLAKLSATIAVESKENIGTKITIEHPNVVES